MTLPILLIFYVSKWKNNKKHWKIGIWRHCNVIIGCGKSKLGVGLLCMEMIIVCKFHDPSIMRNKVNTEIKAAKKVFYNSKFIENNGDPR